MTNDDGPGWGHRAGVAALIVLAGMAGACGSDGPDAAGPNASSATGGTAVATVDPAVGTVDPALAESGRQLALTNGCAACHGTDGAGGVGPAWVGLAGSTVELADGTSLVADDVYLRRSILEPDAEIVAEYGVAMPRNGLEPDEIDAVIAYIMSLRD